jgi:hypothetical protein
MVNQQTLNTLLEKLVATYLNVGVTYNQSDSIILYIPSEDTNNPALLTCMVSIKECPTESDVYGRLKIIIDGVLGMNVSSAGDRKPLNHPWMALMRQPFVQSVTHSRFNVDDYDKKLANDRGGFLVCEITDQTGVVHNAFTDIKHFPMQTQQYLLSWKRTEVKVDCVSDKIANAVHDLIHSNYNSGWADDDNEDYQIMLTNEITGQGLTLMYKNYHSIPTFIEEINKTSLEEDIVYALSYLDDAGIDIFDTIATKDYLKPNKVVYVAGKDEHYVLSAKHESITENQPMDKINFEKTPQVATPLHEETPLTPNEFIVSPRYELPKFDVRVSGNKCVFEFNDIDELSRIIKYLSTLNAIFTRSKEAVFSVTGNHVTFATACYNHCSLTVSLTDAHKFDERNLYGSIVEWLLKDDLFIVLAVAVLTEDGNKFHPDIKSKLDEMGIGDIVISAMGKSGYIASSNGSDDIPF